MPLVVLNVAYPFARIAPDAGYDAERTIAQLDASLVRAGHESVVMACEGSLTEGILLATGKPSDALVERDRHLVYGQYRFTLRRFLEKWPIDLIHMHGVDFYEYLPPPGVPVLVTLHSPLHHYPAGIFQLGRPRTFLNCVSARQRQNCPPCSNLLPDVELDDATRSRRSDQYLILYERLVSDIQPVETRMPQTTTVPVAAD